MTEIALDRFVRPARSVSLRRLVARAHAGWAELGAIVLLYLLYEACRGAVDGSLSTALAHSRQIVDLERWLGLFWEHRIQDATAAVPGLDGLLGLAYVTLHLGATAGVLVWIHRRHHERFPLVRTALVVATALALTIYFAYPAAPPRLAGVGLADTVSTTTHVNLSSNLLGSFYNPIAAVPSLHFGYALLVGLAVAALARRPLVRVLGALYPAFVLLVIVATGNHFLFDAF